MKLAMLLKIVVASTIVVRSLRLIVLLLVVGWMQQLVSLLIVAFLPNVFPASFFAFFCGLELKSNFYFRKFKAERNNFPHVRTCSQIQRFNISNLFIS